MRRVIAAAVVVSVGFALSSSVAAPRPRGERAAASQPASRPAYPSTDQYEPRQIEGWKVYVQKDLLQKHAQTAASALRLLEVKLFEISRIVPAKALERLRSVPIWLGVKDVHGRHPCACYHPDRGWLVANGYNPDMAKAVEISNAANFLTWSHQQPAMVLHELAHAYHDQVFGYGNDKIAAVYRKARDAGKYESVLRSSGRRERAYALNNPMEYFAELTEAYFGQNDYFPFVRVELKEHDPDGYQMIQEFWGVR